MNFPEGARIIWPQGFDLLLATIARASTDGTPAAVERISAIAIPVLGLLAIGAVYAFARVSLAGARDGDGAAPGAGVAAVAFAVIPLTVDYSMLGYVDHHVMEPLFVALAAAFLLAGFARTGARAAIGGAAAGFCAAIACWFVTVGLAIVILVSALATWEAIRGRLPGARAAGLAAVGGATLTLLALCAAQGEVREMSYLTLSAFHAHLALAGAALAFSAVLAAWKELPPARRAAGAFAGLAVAAVTIAHGGAALLAPLGEAAGFLTRTEGFASQVRESEPLWKQGRTDFFLALTPLGILAPFALGFAALRDREARRPAALLSLALLAMGLAQIRFMPLGSVGIAWAAGWLADRAWRGAGRFQRVPRAGLRGAAIAAIVLACAAPKLLDLDPEERLAPHQDDLDLAATFGTLRDPSMDLDALDRRPAWGVIAPWRVGHYLVYRGGVPVVASPFGQAPWHLEGVRRMVRFNLAESDEEAAEVCRRLRVRYVVTSDPIRAVFNDTRVLGIATDRFARLTTGPGGEAGVLITPEYLHTAAFRLHLLDGRAVAVPGIVLPAMASFRLVWESTGLLDARIGSVGPLQIAQPAYYKVFELVPGARVSGRCAPGEPVRLETSIRTNTGRIFDWAEAAACGPDGTYLLRAPYASETAHLVQGSRERAIAIGEAQVRDGSAVSADLTE